MQPAFFTSQQEFREWLEKNYDKEKEIWVGLYKKSSGKKAILYKEAVDEALCFGWIDGLAKAFNKESYIQRFTPRKKTSMWSLINIKRIGELEQLGLLHPFGKKVFEERDTEKTGMYSFEQKEIKFDQESQRLFKENDKAWKNFQTFAPSYQRTTTWWVVSAKKGRNKKKETG